MDKILFVFIGGGLGALLRYGATLYCARCWGTAFPWGTLVVNLAGCFLIGVLFTVAERTALIPPAARLFLLTGFLGGLTTFSTFGLESALAARAGETHVLLWNLAAHNLGGLLLVALGMVAGRLFR